MALPWLYNKLRESGKQWDNYEAMGPPNDFPSLIDVTDSYKKGIWTYFTVQVTGLDGKTRSLERSAWVRL